MNEVTRFHADMLWVNPTASSADVAGAVLPPGDAPTTTWPCRVVTERKRVMDERIGKRVTRDWRVGHFLLWEDGVGAPDMTRTELRAIHADARAQRLDEIVVYGQRALISPPKLAFRQFGVRDFATIPGTA